MPFYVYVPNTEGRGDGYVSNAHENQHDAECEAATIGGRARVIEAAKPSFRHLHAYVEKGWKKCEACGRPTPPWRQKEN